MQALMHAKLGSDPHKIMGMARSKPTTKAIIADNLEFLRTVNGERLSNRRIAERAGVRPGTVDNLFKPERSSPNLETVDALARAFRVEPWMLIMPDLKAVMGHRKRLQKLIQWYAHADAAGQRLIDEVAERSADYKKPNGRPQ